MKHFQELGQKRGVARLLDCLACSAALQCKPERALRLAGAAAAMRRVLGAPLPLMSKRGWKRLWMWPPVSGAYHSCGRLDGRLDDAI